MEKDKSWRPTQYLCTILLKTIKINKGQNTEETYEIILEPYKGRWIPSLSNSKLITNDNTIMYNPFNQNFTSRNPIDRKKARIF